MEKVVQAWRRPFHRSSSVGLRTQNRCPRCLGEAGPASGILPAIVVYGSPCYRVMPEAVPLRKLRPALAPTTGPSLSSPNPSEPWTSKQLGNGTCLNMTSTIVEFRLRDYGPANGHLTQVNLVCFFYQTFRFGAIQST